jgi:diguanylate cyclase (GGDEF)-like protein
MATTATGYSETFGRERLFHDVGPLVGASFAALLALALSQADGDEGSMLLHAATVTCLTVAALSLVPWRRLPPVAQAGAPLIFMFVGFLIRQATGGAESLYAQMLLIPLLWLAAYGTRLEVAGGVLWIAALLSFPAVFEEGGLDQLPRVALFVLIASALGFGVQHLFAYLRVHSTELVSLARTDPLTGVANRRAFDEDFEGILERCLHERQPLCVALIDIDHFKEFNDTHGHQAGDRLLKEITAHWRSQLRDGDVIARLGGDEFAVVLPGCPLASAERIVARLCIDSPTGATCSTGLASWDGGEPASELYARADAALYAAKENGRDQIVVA